MGTLDAANMSYKNYETFNQNVFQQMDTNKQATLRRRMTENEENICNILKPKQPDI